MYRVEFTPQAADDLGKLDKPIAQRVLTKIRWLAENLETLSPEALSGQWSGVYKLRVGDYRILYTFNKAKLVIVVHFVRHRQQVYKTR